MGRDKWEDFKEIITISSDPTHSIIIFVFIPQQQRHLFPPETPTPIISVRQSDLARISEAGEEQNKSPPSSQLPATVKHESIYVDGGGIG